jgi:hypothetical protein
MFLCFFRKLFGTDLLDLFLVNERRAKRTVEANFVGIVCDDQDAFADEERWESLLKCFPTWGE